MNWTLRVIRIDLYELICEALLADSDSSLVGRQANNSLGVPEAIFTPKETTVSLMRPILWGLLSGSCQSVS